MSQLVNTKRQANFKILTDLEPLRGSSNKKNVVSNSFVCKLGFFGIRGPLTSVLNAHECQKSPIYTGTR
jgi:hypothetical protein